MALALHPHGVGVPDWPPPFEYALADLPRMLRTCLPAIEAHYSDGEAWELLFTDELRLQVFRAVHGNRSGPRPRVRLCPHRLPRATCALPECAQRRGLEAAHA